MRRLLAPVPATPPPTLRIEGPAFHHLVQVLRTRENDEVEVFDGTGRAFLAKVARVDAKWAELALGEARPQPPLRPISVLQGLPKADKLELVLQKGTELGAAAFFPVQCARSVVQLDLKRATAKQARWEKIVAEAARQCGRADVPQVHPVSPLLEALRALAPGTQVLVLDESERDLPLSWAAQRAGEKTPLALVIGPEGGLSPEEVAGLRGAGAQCVTLGRRILRTETAALAALAVLLHLDGELG